MNVMEMLGATAEQMQLFIDLDTELRSINRFNPSARSRSYVSALVQYARDQRTVPLQPGSTLYRARRMNPTDRNLRAGQPYGHSEMLAPPAAAVTSGRLNPNGIPYLYVAGDPETAIAEVRPGRGSFVTVASIRTLANSKLVDLEHRYTSSADAITDLNEHPIWNDFLTRAFALPIESGAESSYIVTQYIAECFKQAGFDGVRYDSSLRDGGVNTALFRPEAAEVTDVYLAEVTSVTYRHRTFSRSS